MPEDTQRREEKSSLENNDAFLYGLLNSFGRFHKSDIHVNQQNDLQKKMTYFYLGEIGGYGLRAIAGAIVIYLTTQNITGAILSVVFIVVGDKALTTSTSKPG